MKNQESSDLKIGPEMRKFKKLNSISKMLKCSICLQVFHQPTRLYCGHTFCFHCLANCRKTQPDCPFCRSKIQHKKIGKDLLAFNMINELIVYCIDSRCPWEGPLSLLGEHMKYECIYQQLDGKGEIEGERLPNVDEEVQQKINENVIRGDLLSRVLMKDNSKRMGAQFQVVRKMISSSRSVSVSNKDKVLRPQADNSGLEYLLQLYQNSQ